jgi:hypothetical protein
MLKIATAAVLILIGVLALPFLGRLVWPHKSRVVPPGIAL